MGRLIDADEFKKNLKFMFVTEQMTGRLCEMLCKMVDEQPTAYDVDKVVERLEKCLTDNNNKYMNHQIGTEEAIEREVCYTTAIDYVKAGGVQNE